MSRRVSFLLGAGLVVLALLGGATRSPAAITALAPARFAPAAGWQVRVGKPHACVGVSASRCSQVTTVASSTRFRDGLECLPHRTVAAMRAQDVAIKLTVAIERPTRRKRTFAWPPRIVRRAVAGLEGLPARIGVYQGSTLVGSRKVFVFVVFGRAVPTNRQLTRVNAELRRSRHRLIQSYRLSGDCETRRVGLSEAVASLVSPCRS